MQDRHLALVDATVPALVAAVVVVGERLQGGDSARPVPIVLGVAAAAVLSVRRRWPGWTLGVSGALVAVLFHLVPAAGAAAVLAPAVALYSLALRRDRAHQVAGAVLAVGAVVTADVVHGGRPGLGQTIGHVLLVAIPLLAAETMRTHRSNVRLLVERLELAERAREQEAERQVEQERMRIARELHDVVAHTLTEINVQAAAAAERSEPGDVRSVLERIEDTSHRAIGELRAIVGVLREPSAEATEAPRTPVPGIDEIAELVERARAGGLTVGLSFDGSRPARISDATSLAAYRIVQESLTNARRHAPGADVAVRVCFDADAINLSIRNGRGASADGASATPGVGIAGMCERAVAIGGSLDAGPTVDGFHVGAHLPYLPRR